MHWQHREMWSCAILLLVGLLGMAAERLGSPALAQLAFVLAASPRPRVFTTSPEGFGTLGSAIYLEWTDQEGAEHQVALTPDLIARLWPGPGFRKEFYCLTIDHGLSNAHKPGAPRLRFAEEILRVQLGPQNPIYRELGSPPPTVVRVRAEPQSGPARWISVIGP